MTLQELSKYYKLHERLERNREMLASLYAAAGLGAQEITGMPHASGVSDQVSNLVIEIEDLKERISHLESRCAEEKKRLEKYIGAIKDDQTRMIFRLRFLHCMTWPQVAEAIGGRNTANSVKLICHRYLNPKS
ncbi:hypothetical protein [Anaerotruncus sp. 1XD42-93]|uniref:hypothetical protein n=1 Tax=Anaerotruncus sp. 1XD42-93 TaxID=2320853 RepID=UPI000EA3A522|nr:hypothetical protein [Anaerotruncus sp. 1XD42-93]NBK19148.1 hypothetical protein [Anaerotruncus sp. 1XD42-93]RKJ82474.1 hypothetical protein D7Y41_23705 [Anaerotruncus sp. 1XD22-93]